MINPNFRSPQVSDWSVEPTDLSHTPNKISPNNNFGKQSTWYSQVSPLLYGLLLGALTGGIPLAVVTTVWLSSSNNTVSTSVTTIATTISTISLPSQCSSYTVINDITRLTTATGGFGCDQSLFSSNITLVRFTGSGGTQIPTTIPNSNQCGTQATGWYNGSMPASGVTVNGKVCYNYGSNICYGWNTITVTNCSSYYVYGLFEPFTCDYRYCTV